MKQNKEKMERPEPWPNPPEKISKLDIGDDNGSLLSIYAIEDKINEIIDVINKGHKPETIDWNTLTKEEKLEMIKDKS